MRFSKQRMIDRVKKAGLGDRLTEDIIKTMDNLDGQEATASCWRRQVYGEPVLWVVGKDGTGEYVSEEDCA